MLNSLYIYETVDGTVGASIDIEDENFAILTTRTLSKDKIKEILENGDMTLPLQVISDIKSKYL